MRSGSPNWKQRMKMSEQVDLPSTADESEEKDKRESEYTL